MGALLSVATLSFFSVFVGDLVYDLLKDSIGLRIASICSILTIMGICSAILVVPIMKITKE
jgi:hypothetical protein